ncbi:MAG: hypothetical protein PHE06_09195, partial [Lachnospiraceae bacterium]|nr:hypothetical protein [Lachnospiraceae bacterium]
MVRGNNKKDVDKRQNIRRKRRNPNRNNPVIKRLEIVLGVLCVVLVAALVWQNYYSAHTYQKGELAQLAQGETQSRLKFMTEKVTEAPAAGAGSGTGTASGEDGSENTGAAEDGTGTSAAAAGTSADSPNETAVAANTTTVVESAESASLKNQLMGVLPGIQKPGSTEGELIAEADRMAAMYDYDAASELLQKSSAYNDSTAMQDAVRSYQATKSTCEPYPIEQITHVFFHTLIKDAKKAFDGDQYEDGYNQYMVTIDEFNSIIQQMYDNGYVLVTLYDMVSAATNAQGEKEFSAGSIMLPQGKKPFVLSQDDVCYYHYMDGDGFASKLVVDENGAIRNEYIEEDGSISVGDYDMVPLIDR